MLLYPVNLNINNRLCVVVGGGAVASRKVRGLLAAGAAVRVISPVLRQDLYELSRQGRIEWLDRDYAHGDVADAFLVFAATDNRAVQEEILTETMENKGLINSVDDPRHSHFHVPANFRRGSVLVTVSTSGGSPVLAGRLRRQLESLIGEEYEAVVYLLSLIRAEIVAAGGDSRSNSQLFNRLLDRGLVELVRKKNWFELQMLLVDVLPDTLDGVAIMKQFMELYGVAK
jgi:precorrin-2 dehydrogenase/sirohydrochlorin ferrochelatase